ncbi:hypothetical protein [Rhodopila sp.]|uniref:hypothetical protein n=1 Tax=Rhodopila sp. TaxID=2480087 RepID=UPI003D11B0CB
MADCACVGVTGVKPEPAAATAHSDHAFPGDEDVRTLTGLTNPDAMPDFYLRPGSKLVLPKMGEAGW